MKTNEFAAEIGARILSDPGWEEAACSYWLRPDGWPIDARGQVFLARAVHELGRARFPDKWTGTEPSEQFLPYLNDPLLLLGFSAYADAGRGVLDYWIKDRVSDTDGPLLSRREAALAVSLFEEHYGPARRAGAARFHEITRLLTVALADGNLSSSTRPIEGGAFTPVSADVWNADGIGWRFAYCVMSPDDPFHNWGGALPTIEDRLSLIGRAGGFDHRSLRPHYIFVARPGLDALRSSSPNEKGGGHPAVPLAPAPEIKLARSTSAIIEAVLSDWAQQGGPPSMRPTEQEVIAAVKAERPATGRGEIREKFAEAKKMYPAGAWTRRGSRPS